MSSLALVPVADTKSRASASASSSGKKKKRSKQPKAAFATPQTGLGPNTAKPNSGGGFSAKQNLIDVFTKQDESLVGYLESVTNPWSEGAGRVPLIVGGFVLQTDTFQTVYEGEAFAGAAGVAMVSCDASGWVENANTGAPAFQYESYAAGVQGSPIFSSSIGTIATSFPTTSSFAGVNFTPTNSRVVDPAWNTLTRMRVVSMGLEVWSSASQNLASGKILIASTVLPNELAGNGAIAGCSYNQLVSTPQRLIERSEAPLGNWATGVVLRAFAIPSVPVCFELNQLPATGATLYGAPMLGAIAQGMTSGQSFSWRVTYNFEACADVSNKTSVELPRTIHAGIDRVAGALPHIKPYSAMVGNTATLNRMPVAAHALVQQMSETRPSHALALTNAINARNRPYRPDRQDPGMDRAVGPPRIDWLSTIGGLAKTALTKIGEFALPLIAKKVGAFFG